MVRTSLNVFFAALLLLCPLGSALAQGGAGGAGAGGGPAGAGTSAAEGGNAVGGGAPAGAVGGGAPAGAVGGGAPRRNDTAAGSAASSTAPPPASAARAAANPPTTGGVIGGATGVGNAGSGVAPASQPTSEQSSAVVAPVSVQGVAEQPGGSSAGLAEPMMDGTTKIVRARPCSEAAHETDGTTTCVGLPVKR
jgi:hypothetical protein